MNRPWLIWLLSLCCAAGIFGAMGVITHRSLRLEQEGVQARADAELQERLRLALWRMETDASALMIEENNRPPEQFRASLNAPSPLATSLPKHVRLHFDISAVGLVTSPQVPMGVKSSSDPLFQVAERNLKQLRQMLSRSPSAVWCTSVMAPEAPLQSPVSLNSINSFKGAGQLGNLTFLDAAAKNKGPFEQAPLQGQQTLTLNGVTNDITLNGGPLQGVLSQSPAAAEAMKQQSFNEGERSSRSKVYTKNTEGKNYLDSVPQSASAPADEKKVAEKADKAVKPQAQATAIAQQKSTGKPEKPSQTSAQPAMAQVETRLAKDQAGTAPSSEQTGRLTANPVPAPATPSVLSPPPAESAQLSVTPFRPFWLENELFLVREVAESGRRHVQGVWLDAASLKASLLELVADILPQAALQAVANVAFVPGSAGELMPSPSPASGDPMDLVGLPWKLVPGETAVAIIQGWTPMRFTLAAAWMGALLAAFAAAGLLFGVTRLSERRAAFVSSVTHELRTPLTTFRLYSELLEQGMVREEADRTQYLHTLRTEAERLTHLVDNVLAYSRIERTNRRSRMESLDLVPWLERVEGRLEDRTREAGMKLEVRTSESDDDLSSVTDATGLEQIVFNLVDNACKYAGGRCADPVVRLSLERRGRWIELRVCDTGPGIPRGERSRLFTPFHKSADEAANSKPGVGLGLALCHRLAGALGGKLILEKPKAQAAGACFVLRLPVA